MACGDFKHPLLRGGTSQLQRLAAGLRPGYVRVDEKDLADWIVYADALSGYINYYDLDNAKSGTWRPYFSADVAAILAFVAVQNPDALAGIGVRFRALRDDANQGDPALLQKTLGELFGAVLTFSQALDNLNARLSQDVSLRLPLSLVIDNLIRLKLGPALNRLLGYYKAAQAGGLLTEADATGWRILGSPVVKPSTVIAAGLSDDWITNSLATTWTTYNTGISADASIYGDAGGTTAQKIRHAANHNLFTSQFDQYLMAYARILKEAQANLQVVLGDWRRHPPHYALFLGFLKLMKTAQSDLNQFTTRHLKFYYLDVLRLKPRTPDPDSAYVTIELTKSVSEHLLPEGTLFRAGKDSAGQDVFYGLTKDVVFNKAKVAKLMAVYEGSDRDDLTGVVNDQRLFAAPVVNSADGLGAKLTSAQGEWHPLINRTYVDGQVQSINEPAAQIGFAIASHYLAMAEGRRAVMIRLNTSSDASLTGLHCDVLLTTAKGWFQASGVVISTGTLKDGTTPCAVIEFTLDPLAPAIVDYDPAVHGGTLGVEVPVAKVVLQNVSAQPYDYEAVRDVTVVKVEVQVDVGSPASGMFTPEAAKQLVLANSVGPVDPAKPFLAFGPQPAAGDAFIIGSREIFSKKGARIRFNAEWLKLPVATDEMTCGVNGGQANYTYQVDEGNVASYSQTVELAYGANGHFNFKHAFTGSVTFDNATFGDPIVGTPKKGYFRVVNVTPPSVTLQYLSGGVWKNLSTGVSIFNNANSQVSIPAFPASLQTIPDEAAVAYDDASGPFTNQSTAGFFRLKLNSGFGHKEYQAALTDYLISQAKSGPGGPPPPEPYTPTMQSLLISYTAIAGVDLTATDAAAFEDRDVRFFHLYPFGGAEQHVQIGGGGSVYLMPQFRYIETPSDPGAGSGGSSVALKNRGEFYVGLEGVDAGQSVSILFQVLEGTTDPFVLKPDEHVYFSYLSDNTWKAIRRNLVGDSTLQLIKSGLIELAIPEDATTTHTILPAGYIWLRFSVAEAAEAICKLLAVLPQAVLVTYQPGANNAPDFPAGPLPAGTISKLKEPVSAIKKIEQPYVSFRVGGGGENEQWFQVRVSERLRHKDRAITIWDYERLVLEKFPQIHKVKCLSHTKLVADQENPGETLYNELAPGYVLMITIPDLKNRNDANPLRPYTSADLLVEIQDYLKARTSCHAKVIAANPLFEELRMEFTVTLMKGYNDASYYRELLQNEITQYLTPWAFGGTTDIQFGGKVYKSSLIDFIEERPYVDFLTDVKLYHKAGDGAVESGDREEVVASTARSILVSAPASKHNITVLLHEEAAEITEECTCDE